MYLPNSNIAATVIFPSGRMKRRLRSSFSPSCPLAIADRQYLKRFHGMHHPPNLFSPILFQTCCLKSFDGLLVQVLNRSIPNTCFIRRETASVGHHLGKLGIIEHFALVGTVLHPHNTPIVMVGLIHPFFNMSHNKASAIHRNSFHINKDGRNNIL